MRVMFFWPGCGNLPTLGVPLLMAILREAGHEVRFFSSSPYHPWPRSSRGSLFRSSDCRDNAPDRDRFLNDLERGCSAFRSEVERFRPDVIGLSALSTNYEIGMTYLRSIPKDFFLLVGGAHAMVKPHQVISDPLVDAVCVGEAEPMILEFINHFQRGGNYSGVPNLWYKSSDREVIRNECGVTADLEKLPSLAESGMEPEIAHFVGRRYRRFYGETSRGCPHNCSFCANRELMKLTCGTDRPLIRRMPPSVAVGKFVDLKQKLGIEMLRIVDENFLAAPITWLEEFCKLYAERVNLPFTISASAITLTEERVDLIKKAGCVNVNFGLESGGEEYRKTVLNKAVSDDDIINVVRVLEKHKLRANSGVIIGLPGQSDAILTETVELIRKTRLPVNIEFFLPTPGSLLYDKLVSRGEFTDLKDGYDCYRALGEPVYIAEGMSREKLIGLARTMLLYAHLPRSLSKLVGICDRESDEANRVLDALESVFSF